MTFSDLKEHVSATGILKLSILFIRPPCPNQLHHDNEERLLKIEMWDTWVARWVLTVCLWLKS